MWMILALVPGWWLMTLQYFAYAANPIEWEVTTKSGGLNIFEKDMLCACRQFNTYFTGLNRLKTRSSVNSSDELCIQHGFNNRWSTLFPGRVELGVGEGLRALIFKSSITNDKHETLIVAFRHFEYDNTNFIDRDFWQELGWFGSEYLRATLGEEVDEFVRTFVYIFRKYLGLDYHLQAFPFLEEIQSRGKKKRIFFTGYGMGGLHAQMQSIYYQESSAVVFAAPFVSEKFLNGWGLDASMRITNILYREDEKAKFKREGEKRTFLSSKVCVYAASPSFPKTLSYHEATIYSDDFGLLSLPMDAIRECYAY